MTVPRLPRIVWALLRWAAGTDLADEVEGDLYEWMHRWAGPDAGVVRRGAAWLRGTAAALLLAPRFVLGRAAGRVRRGGASAGWSLDVRLALRLLRRHPGLSAVSVVALAVTMSLATALFTVTRAALFSTLDVEGGERIAVVALRDAVTRQDLVATFREYEAWRGSETFEHTSAFVWDQFNLAEAGVPIRSVRGARVTPSLFDFNGPVPVLGSLFSESSVRENPRVMLIREDLWRAAFGGDPAIVGRTLQVNGDPHEVVGVVPESWAYPSDQSLWVPLGFPTVADPAAHHASMYMVGRVAPGVSFETARAETQRRLDAVTPLPDRRPEAQVRAFVRGFSDPTEVPVFGAGVLALVLLVVVAAANVANLILARTAARRGEIAVRSALGASRGRIVGQLFVEAIVLTLVAAAIAIAVSSAGLAWLETVVTELPYYMDLRPGPAVMSFAGGLALLAAVFAGVVPALRATRGGMSERVRGAASAGFGRLSQAVIVVELAVSVALLGTSFAFAQSFWGYTRGASVDLDGDRVLTASIYVPWEGEIAETEDLEAFGRATRAGIREELEQLVPPGAVGFTLDLPGTEAQRSRVQLEGTSETHVVRSVSVDHGFFSTLEVTPASGRAFAAADFDEGARQVVVVNEPFVRDVLLGRNAIGLRLRFRYGDGSEGEWNEVVGVVPDLGHNPGDARAGAAVYRTMPGANYATIMVRAGGALSGDPLAILPAVRAGAFAVDPRIQVRDARLLRDAARDERALLTGLGSALALLGSMALLLSAAGLHAVLSFGVSSRTREIGVRIALGASAASIVRSIGRSVGVGLVLGCGAGIGLGALLLRGVTVLPFEINTYPILHLGAPTLLLATVAVASLWRPVRRALGIQPAEALRAD